MFRNWLRNGNDYRSKTGSFSLQPRSWLPYLGIKVTYDVYAKKTCFLFFFCMQLVVKAMTQ